MYTDPITTKRIDELHPKLRDEARSIINEIWSKDIPCRISQGLRTWAEQQGLYEQGRTRPGKVVTNAPAGSSFHNYGLAVDIVLLDAHGVVYSDTVDLNGDGKADWGQIVDIFEAHGWEWGGRWKSIKDKPHFQKTFGHSVAWLKIHADGGKIQYPQV